MLLYVCSKLRALTSLLVQIPRVQGTTVSAWSWLWTESNVALSEVQELQCFDADVSIKFFILFSRVKCRCQDKSLTYPLIGLFILLRITKLPDRGRKITSRRIFIDYGSEIELPSKCLSHTSSNWQGVRYFNVIFPLRTSKKARSSEWTSRKCKIDAVKRSRKLLIYALYTTLRILISDSAVNHTSRFSYNFWESTSTGESSEYTVT